MAKTQHILIVEDETDLNQAYEMMLQQAGYHTTSAFDGNQALDKLEQVSPDIILLDLRMPGLDGIGFLRRYNKQVPANKRAKILVFSNLDMQQEIDEAYELGAERYLLKAWASPQELIKVVQATLAS